MARLQTLDAKSSRQTVAHGLDEVERSPSQWLVEAKDLAFLKIIYLQIFVIVGKLDNWS